MGLNACAAGPAGGSTAYDPYTANDGIDNTYPILGIIGITKAAKIVVPAAVNASKYRITPGSGRHGPHHEFNGVKRKHIQIDIYKPGVKGSHKNIIRFPYGK